MEARTNTLLRALAFLGLLVVSLAVASAPKNSVIIPDKISLTCAAECAKSCDKDISEPLKYALCVGHCVTTCEGGEAPPPPSDNVIPDTFSLKCAAECAISCGKDISEPLTYAVCVGHCVTTCEGGEAPPSSANVPNDCTRSCLSSLRKVMPTTTKPYTSDLTHYTKGYVDSCYQSCSKNNKLH